MERNEDFKNLCKKHSPKSDIITDTLRAALAGGLISFIGQWAVFLFKEFGISENDSYIYTTFLFIALASIFTSLGIFDRIAAFAGAGTLVPVTGFANAVTSSAIDARCEGVLAGVGTKIFTVAGPVILFSSVGGILYGFVYFLYTILSR